MNPLSTRLLRRATASLGCVGVVSAAPVTLSILEAGRTKPLPVRFDSDRFCHPLGGEDERDGVLDNEAWGRPRDRAKYPGPQGNGRYTQDIYYLLLNTGLRLPPSAGSASGVLPNPVGYDRAYVHVDGEFTYKKWRKGLKASRSFVSNGPLLRARSNGFLAGHVFRANGSMPVVLEATLDSRDPIASVELVRDGRVERVNLPARFTIRESGWFLLRATAGVTNTLRFASTAPWYVEVDGRPMQPRRESAQFFVDWSRERMAKLDALTEITTTQKEELIQPWREAEAFWRGKLAATVVLPRPPLKNEGEDQ